MKKHRFLLTGIISLSCLAFCVLASVACGAKSVGFQTVIRSLFIWARAVLMATWSRQGSRVRFSVSSQVPL